MSIYSHSVTGLLAEFAVKKYCSHRGVTTKDLVNAKSEKDTRDAKLFSARKGKFRA